MRLGYFCFISWRVLSLGVLWRIAGLIDASLWVWYLRQGNNLLVRSANQHNSVAGCERTSDLLHCGCRIKSIVTVMCWAYVIILTLFTSRPPAHWHRCDCTQHVFRRKLCIGMCAADRFGSFFYGPKKSPEKTPLYYPHLFNCVTTTSLCGKTNTDISNITAI